MTAPPHDDHPPLRLPPWLRVKTGKASQCADTRRLVSSHGLNTVCENAQCPNIGECYSSQTATFLILGRTCTRHCGFCAVAHGSPGELDPQEPHRVAEAAARLGLDYVVVTSVTRDDLPDGGAGHFAATIRAVRELSGAQVEVLIPDFGGDRTALAAVLEAGPAVLNHNVETIRRLSPRVRPQADYARSLGVLSASRELAPGTPRKSGLMVGLGETDEEVRQLLTELRQAGCQILTIGQYLRPSRRHLPVERYVEPAMFEEYQRWGRDLGLAAVVSGPFVRSSYRAAEVARALLAHPT